MLFSVGHCALRMDDGINCPKCDRSDLSKRGYFGHMQMQHGVGSEEARALLNGEAPEKPGSSASADASEQAAAPEANEAGAQATAQDLLDADPDGDGDPVDKALSEWIRRRRQISAVRALSEVDGGGRADRPGPDDGGDGSAVDDLIAEVGADAIRDALTADDDGMTEEDVRRAVRQEVDRTAVADGAGPVGDWKVQALSEGADPETVAELAAAESGGGLADAVGTLADKLAGSEAGEAIAGGVADAGADVVADALRAVASGRSEPQAPPEYRQYREADPRAAEAGQSGSESHGPADAPEVATDAQRAPGADASGREVRRSEERLARVTDPDDRPDDYAVPSEYDGGGADE